MTVRGVHGVALEEGLVGHEVDTAVVRVANDVDGSQDALNAVPAALVGLNDSGRLGNVVGIPLKKLELECGL